MDTTVFTIIFLKRDYFLIKYFFKKNNTVQK
jgi:hypothetical protein